MSHLGTICISHASHGSSKSFISPISSSRHLPAPSPTFPTRNAASSSVYTAEPDAMAFRVVSSCIASIRNRTSTPFHSRIDSSTMASPSQRPLLLESEGDVIIPLAFKLPTWIAKYEAVKRPRHSRDPFFLFTLLQQPDACSHRTKS